MAGSLRLSGNQFYIAGLYLRHSRSHGQRSRSQRKTSSDCEMFALF